MRKNTKPVKSKQIKNLEILTLTCTWAVSYGAALQAYALTKKLNNMGLSAKVLNYQPNYYNVRTIKSALTERVNIKLLDKIFLKFLRDTRMITKNKYNNIADLSHANLSASVFIVGSDQVWNCTKYYNGKDDAMFLEFVHPKAIKISYAASLAMPKVPEEQVNRYKNMLEKFNAISVRESTSVKALTKIGVNNVKTVIDPVYLVGQAEWTALAKKSSKNFTKEKYVLIICLEERDDSYKYARKKADKLGVKLYTFRLGINLFKKHVNVDKTYLNISVYDYLNIIRNAEAVISDSFHAMSFSLIFNRDIDIILRNDKGNSRMVDLLNDLELSERVIDLQKVLTDKINFTKVNQLIDDKVTYATEFIQNAIEDHKNE